MTLAVQLLLSAGALIAEGFLVRAALAWEDRSISGRVAAMPLPQTRPRT